MAREASGHPGSSAGSPERRSADLNDNAAGRGGIPSRGLSALAGAPRARARMRRIRTETARSLRAGGGIHARLQETLVSWMARAAALMRGSRPGEKAILSFLQSRSASSALPLVRRRKRPAARSPPEASRELDRDRKRSEARSSQIRPPPSPAPVLPLRSSRPRSSPSSGHRAARRPDVFPRRRSTGSRCPRCDCAAGTRPTA